MGKKLSKKKIIYIANVYTHHKFFNSFLINKILKKGNQVVVVSREDIAFDFKNKNVRFYNWDVNRTGVNPFKELLSLMELIRIIKKENPDVVHNFTIKANIYGTIAAKFFSQAKIINTVNGLGYVYTETSKSNWFGRTIIKYIWLLALKISDSILFMNSDDRKLFFKKLIKNQTDIIPGHGVDLKKFSIKNFEKNRSQLITSIIGDQRNKIIITFVGRLIRQKGLIELWQAAKNIIKEFDNVIFLVVGMKDLDNPSRITDQEINKMKGKNFIFLFNRSDVPEILSLSDIFVLPSYREGGPQVIIEAMAMGLPIVTTDVPGCKERVENNYNGILVPEKNSVALQKAITDLILDRKMREIMGKRNRLLAKKYYNQDILTDRVVAHYELNE